MRTSYFGISKNDRDAVAICRYVPEWYTGRTCEALAPSAELLRDWRAKKITEEEYTLRYYQETLSNLDPEDIYQLYKYSILICYERRGSFCHRHIVAKWLEDCLGVTVKEIGDSPAETKLDKWF